jgi:hypothetical protein
MLMLSLGVFFANGKGSNFLSSRGFVPVSTHDLGPPSLTNFDAAHGPPSGGYRRFHMEPPALSATRSKITCSSN